MPLSFSVHSSPSITSLLKSLNLERSSLFVPCKIKESSKAPPKTLPLIWDPEVRVNVFISSAKCTAILLSLLIVPALKTLPCTPVLKFIPISEAEISPVLMIFAPRSAESISIPSLPAPDAIILLAVLMLTSPSSLLMNNALAFFPWVSIFAPDASSKTVKSPPPDSNCISIPCEFSPWVTSMLPAGRTNPFAGLFLDAIALLPPPRVSIDIASWKYNVTPLVGIFMIFIPLALSPWVWISVRANIAFASPERTIPCESLDLVRIDNASVEEKAPPLREIAVEPFPSVMISPPEILTIPRSDIAIPFPTPLFTSI